MPYAGHTQWHVAETGKRGTGLAIASSAEAAAATAPQTALLAPHTASLGSGEQAVAQKQAGEQQSVLLGPSGGVGSPVVAVAVAFLGAAAEWFDNAIAALCSGIVSLYVNRCGPMVREPAEWQQQERRG